MGILYYTMSLWIMYEPWQFERQLEVLVNRRSTDNTKTSALLHRVVIHYHTRKIKPTKVAIDAPHNIWLTTHRSGEAQSSFSYTNVGWKYNALNRSFLAFGLDIVMLTNGLLAIYVFNNTRKLYIYKLILIMKIITT